MSSRRRFLAGVWPLGMAALRVPAAEASASTPRGVEAAAATIQDAVARGDLPGAVLHVRAGGRVVYERALGRKDIARDRALAPDDLFPVASLTKPVVAAAILALSERGAVRVDAPVSRYLPEFAKPRVLASYDAKTGAMTTRPAGIHHGFAEIDSVFGAIYERASVMHAPRVPLAENVRRLAPLPLVHDPGARWTYGLSSEVLGRVVEVVAGVPLDVYVARTLFEPLAMRRTYFFVPPDERPHVVPWHGTANGALRAMRPIGWTSPGMSAAAAGCTRLSRTMHASARRCSTAAARFSRVRASAP